jgi:flagellar hook-associated protein 2
MSSAGISFGGLASGLDTQAIISALVAVERRPISALETKKTSLNKQKSLFGDLGSLLDKLTKAAKDLKRTTDFLAMKVASDDEDVVAAQASSTAAPGTHTVRVLSLASAQVNAHTGSSSATHDYGDNATMQITVGSDTRFISVGDATLANIASAINEEDDFGVHAEVVDTGNTANGGANRYQLVLRGTETGTENAFTLAYDDGGAAFEALIADLNANPNPRTAATNAQIQLNGGVVIQRATNTITDAITGVTLDLKSVPSPNKDVTITVSTDAEETSKKVQAFVDAYNSTLDFFAAQGELDAEGKAKSALFGDVTLRSIRSNLRRIVGGSVPGTGNESYQMLSQLGIKADTQGKLTFTRSTFEEALADDEQAVAAVFTHATSGIAQGIEAQLDLYTDGVDGLLKTRRDGFDRQVKNTQGRIDQAERRLVVYQKQLEQKYANLESLLTRLQSQGSSFSNIR